MTQHTAAPRSVGGSTLTPPPGDSVPLPRAVSFDTVSKVYDNGFTALDGISLEVGFGEIVTLVGPSGCGKTTVIRMAAGLTSVSSGEIARSTDRIAYVFQDATLLPWKSVRKNVELVAKLGKVPADVRARRATDAIRAVELERFENALPRQLSGGMRMRVSLARAMAADAELMFMDEPFAALDEFTREEMQQRLLDLWRAERFSAMFITHSIREAVLLGHRIVVMDAHPGRVVDVVTSPHPPTEEGDDHERALALRETEERVSRLLAEGRARR